MFQPIDPARGSHAVRTVHAVHALETHDFALFIKYLTFCTCKSARAYVKSLKFQHFARARTCYPYGVYLPRQRLGYPPCPAPHGLGRSGRPGWPVNLYERPPRPDRIIRSHPVRL